MGGGWIHRIGRGDSWKRQTGPGASKIQVREEKPENRILENTRGMSSGAARGIKITEYLDSKKVDDHEKHTAGEES